MDTLEGMRVFISVATEQSFTQGAKRLGISTKLASKYVNQLEVKLGTKLLNRTTRSVNLTHIGKIYLQRCDHILEQVKEMEDLIQEKESALAGPIRITAPTSLGSNQLIDVLSEFKQKHPKVNIDLQLSDSRVSVIEDGFDLAIRFGSLEDSNLIARTLCEMKLRVFCSEEYKNKKGLPEHPHALKTHDCLIFSSSVDPAHWHFTKGRESHVVSVNGSFRSNSPSAILNMALGGCGIGRIPEYIVKKDLLSGELIEIFEEYHTDNFALSVVYPPNRHLTSRIRVLITHLQTYFGCLK